MPYGSRCFGKRLNGINSNQQVFPRLYNILKCFAFVLSPTECPQTFIIKSHFFVAACVSVIRLYFYDIYTFFLVCYSFSR